MVRVRVRVKVRVGVRVREEDELLVEGDVARWREGSWRGEGA